jgi:hypothetical protein
MARYPEVSDDQLAAAARFYLERTGGFLEKIKTLPPAVLDSLPPVCTENLSSGVVVVKSAQDGA